MGNEQVNSSNNLKRILSEIPCSIRSDGESCTTFFEKISYSSIKNRISPKNGSLEKQYIINTENNSNIGKFYFDNIFEANIIHTDNKFKDTFEKYNKKSSQSYYLVVKKVLYTIDIPRDLMKFTKYYRDMFSKKYKNEVAFSMLDKLLRQNGYFVPQKIEIGGLLIFNDSENLYNKFSNNELESTTRVNLEMLNNNNFLSNISDNYIEKKLQYSNVKIIGGNTYEKDLESWEKSININNAAIIGYKFLTDIISLIPFNYKNNLQGGIILLENKYKMREEYIRIYNKVKLSMSSKKNLSQDGHCEESNCPRIKVETIEFRQEGKFMSFAKEKINHGYDNIIIGYKIIDKWKDGTNGKWVVNSCPLLSYQVDMNFVSKWFRGEHFVVKIYIMEVPQ